MVRFECPRCHYKTDKKQHMQNHFNRKRICPSEKGDIELSEYVKNIVYEKRIYHPPSHNNNNTVNYIMNIINTNFTPSQIVDTFTKVQKIEIQPFDDYLDDKFREQQYALEDESKGLKSKMKEDELIELISSVSSVTDASFKDMNLFYDKSDKTINIFEGNEWIKTRTGTGIKTIIEKIKNVLLDYYECKLINKIETSQCIQEKSKDLEDLRRYYSFIASFDLYPFTYNQDDWVVLNEEVVDMEQNVVSEKYTGIYFDCKAKLRPRELSEIRKQAADVVIVNSNIWLRTIKHILVNIASKDVDVQDFITNVTQTNPQATM